MNKLKPKAPVRAQGRIRGLRSSTPASFRSPSPAMLRSPSPAITPPVEPVRKGPAPCQQCGYTSFTEDSGQVICENCGAISIDTGNFSNDIVFGETDSGRTQQVGTRVNEGQTHQRTFMPRNQPLGRIGHEAIHTSEKAKMEAEGTFSRFGVLLGVRQQERNAAGMIFHMAYANGFVRGRTIESVAIVALYLATRRAKDASPPYSLMLIDFAEQANINVFDLGRMMSDMVKRLYLGSDGKLTEKESMLLRAPGAEILIEKFVKHLDFGNDEYKVRRDATKILQRMKKDWLHDGRRPSGVCGAAVILAARMNNYRRTLREVVLCAKVTEFTVNKRLEEFKITDSSKLSVNDFRNDDVREGLRETDPPAFYRASNPPVKKKRGRPRKNPLPETAAEIEDGESDIAEQSTEPQDDLGEPRHKRARIDADGFAVPDVPTRSGSSQAPEQPVKRGSGKPKGSKNWKAPPPTAAEIAFEAEMEHEIQDALDENQDLDSSDQATATSAEPGLQPTPADITVYQHDQPPRMDPPGPPARSNEGNHGNVNMNPDLAEDEFDDDPEVMNCILNDAEKQLKERIWVTENAEWLRQENAKKVKKELKIAHMIEAGIDPEEHTRRKGKLVKRKDGARRSGRVGDVDYLRDDFHKKKRSIGEHALDEEFEGLPEGEEIATGPDAAQAHVAVRKMFNQRGTFSRRINYKNLLDAYQLPSENASLSPSRSPSRDREESVASASSTQTRSNIEWFHGTRKGQQRSRASIGQERRQAKERAEREQRSRERHVNSGSPASVDENDEDDQTVTSKQASPQQQLPTPTQTQIRTKPQSKVQVQTNRLPTEEPASDTDSPLSSTHTPGQGSIASPTREGAQIRVQQEVSEEDIESDEGDYIDDEGDDDDNVEAAFAGQYQNQGGYQWDDEVVEE